MSSPSQLPSKRCPQTLWVLTLNHVEGFSVVAVLVGIRIERDVGLDEDQRSVQKANISHISMEKR